jgi:hypothetical protein
MTSTSIVAIVLVELVEVALRGTDIVTPNGGGNVGGGVGGAGVGGSK